MGIKVGEHQGRLRVVGDERLKGTALPFLTSHWIIQSSDLLIALCSCPKIQRGKQGAALLPGCFVWGHRTLLGVWFRDFGSPSTYKILHTRQLIKQKFVIVCLPIWRHRVWMSPKRICLIGGAVEAARRKSCKSRLFDYLENPATRSMCLKREPNFSDTAWQTGLAKASVGADHGKAMALSRNADEEAAFLRTTTNGRIATQG